MAQRLRLEKELNVHKGCVNSICWNQRGDRILSGSDDQKLILTDPFNSKVHVKYTTVHRSNIFSAKFLPGDDSPRIVSCSGSGSVLYTDLNEVQLVRENEVSQTLVGGSYRAPNEQANYFNCHSGTAYEVITIPSETNSFLSCGEDGTVRFFDLRLVSRCHRQYCRENVLILSPAAVTAMSYGPVSHNYLAVGCSDSIIRIFDRRYLKLVEFPSVEPSNSPPAALSSFSREMQTVPVKMFKMPSDERRTYRITSVVYSSNELELLVSFSSEYLYLFDMSKDGVNRELIMPSRIRRRRRGSPKVLRKLRLRGDWSDTGPQARPASEVTAQSRPQLNSGLMNRMTGLLSRMLSEPRSRRVAAAVSAGGAANSAENIDDNDRVAEGISILFRGDELGTMPLQPHDAGGSSSSANNNGNSSSSRRERQTMPTDGSGSSSSSSEEDSSASSVKYDYVKQKFVGHRNARTMIKEANFYGDDFVS